MTRTSWRTRDCIVCGLAALASAGVFLPGAPAMAELGGASASVQTDRLRLRASGRQVALATHIRHELTLPNGGTLHEYTDAQGQVFAIRWSGPGKPDLRSLLGSHFAAFHGANVARSRRFGALSRRPLTVDGPDVKIESGGHMGYFWGLAWLPALLPAGVQPGDLQ